MTEEQLRAEVARVLRISDVPAPIWQQLKEEDGGIDYVDAARTGDEETFTDLCQEAKRLLGAYHAGASQGRGYRRPAGRVKIRPEKEAYDEDILARIDAVVAYRAKRAASLQNVQRFRKSILGNTLLDDATAREFIASPALQMLERQFFTARGIPFVGHTAQYIDTDDYDEDKGWRGIIDVTSPGCCVSTTVRWTETPALLAIPGMGKDDVLTVHVWSKSVLDELRKLGDWLAAHYDWSPANAVWFVLTGAVPWVSPVRVELDNEYVPRRLILSIEPWLPAEVVTRIYRRYQREMLGGKDNRKLQVKTIELFRFVTEQTTANGQRPPWRNLVDTWNSQHSLEWAYDRHDPRNFEQDYERARRLLINPRYRLGYDPQPESQSLLP